MNWMEELRRLLMRARGRSPAKGSVAPVTCQEALDRVVEWLDGELEGDEVERIGGHLETCARCYPAVRFERAFREAVARAAVVADPCPPAVREGILEALRDRGLDSR